MPKQPCWQAAAAKAGSAPGNTISMDADTKMLLGQGLQAFTGQMPDHEQMQLFF